MAGMQDLPAEVFLYVMPFVRTEDLARAECVCPTWRDLVQVDEHTWRAVFKATFGGTDAKSCKTSWRARCVKAAQHVRKLRGTTSSAQLVDLFMWASACGHYQLMSELLRQECKLINVAIIEERGLFPIHLAVVSGKAEAVEVLIRAGFDPKRLNRKNESVMQLAVKGSHLNIIDVLLQHGIDAEELEKLVKSSKTTRGKNTLPLLHIAASRGSVKVAEKILEILGTGTIAEYDRQGYTALHHAAENGRLEMVKFLVDKGADVNMLTKPLHKSALLVAVKAGKDLVARYLVERGADNAVQPETKRGWSRTILHVACEVQSVTMVDLFLENGISINVRDVRGRVPIHEAVRLPSVNRVFVNYLLSKGADILARDSAGNDVLWHLLTNYPTDERVAMMSDLIDQIDSMEDREDLLIQAVDCPRRNDPGIGIGIQKMFDLLLKKGVKMPSGDGRASIMQKAAYGSLELIQYFLSKGIAIDASEEGLLHDIASCSFPGDMVEKFKFALEHGANPNAPDWLGRSPMFNIIRQMCTNELIELLVSHGADLNRRDNGGITVLFLALLESLCFDSNDYWAESAYTARLLIRCTSYLDPKLCLDKEGYNPYTLCLRTGFTLNDESRKHWKTLFAELGIPEGKQPPTEE